MTEEFPAINSTLSPHALGQLIQQKYGLSNKTECKIFRLAMNHLYIIHDGEEQYVFRVYTCGWRTRLEIEEELRLLNLLKEAGRPVAFPIADQSKTVHSGDRSTGRNQIRGSVFVCQRNKDCKIFTGDRFSHRSGVGKSSSVNRKPQAEKNVLQYGEPA